MNVCKCTSCILQCTLTGVRPRHGAFYIVRNALISEPHTLIGRVVGWMWDFTGRNFYCIAFMYTLAERGEVYWSPRSRSGNQNARIKQSLDITYHFIWYTQYLALLYITMIISPSTFKVKLQIRYTDDWEIWFSGYTIL
jgi:hypothetical protein